MTDLGREAYAVRQTVRHLGTLLLAVAVACTQPPPEAEGEQVETTSTSSTQPAATTTSARALPPLKVELPMSPGALYGFGDRLWVFSQFDDNHRWDIIDAETGVVEATPDLPQFAALVWAGEVAFGVAEPPLRTMVLDVATGAVIAEIPEVVVLEAFPTTGEAWVTGFPLIRFDRDGVEIAQYQLTVWAVAPGKGETVWGVGPAGLVEIGGETATLVGLPDNVARVVPLGPYVTGSTISFFDSQTETVYGYDTDTSEWTVVPPNCPEDECDPNEALSPKSLPVFVDGALLYANGYTGAMVRLDLEDFTVQESEVGRLLALFTYSSGLVWRRGEGDTQIAIRPGDLSVVGEIEQIGILLTPAGSPRVFANTPEGVVEYDRNTLAELATYPGMRPISEVVLAGGRYWVPCGDRELCVEEVGAGG